LSPHVTNEPVLVALFQYDPCNDYEQATYRDLPCQPPPHVSLSAPKATMKHVTINEDLENKFMSLIIGSSILRL